MPAIEVVPRRGHPRSPLRYPGGKTSLAGFFNAIIARRGLNTYVEPYAGGAGAAIELLLSDSVERIVINDLDPAIFAFWKSIVSEPAEFIERVLTAPLTLDEWRRQQRIYRAGAGVHDLLEFGFSTFYLNRTNRSGVMNAGVIGGQSQSGRYRIDARFDRESLAKRVSEIANRRARVKVTNVDGATAIKGAFRLKRALVYADPPYYEKGSFLYLNSFDDSQHKKLAEVLNSRSNENWILTYDDHQRIHDLYGRRRNFNFNLNYSAHRNGRVSELMVLSDSLSQSVATPSMSPMP